MNTMNPQWFQRMFSTRLDNVKNDNVFGCPMACRKYSSNSLERRILSVRLDEETFKKFSDAVHMGIIGHDAVYAGNFENETFEQHCDAIWKDYKEGKSSLPERIIMTYTMELVHPFYDDAEVQVRATMRMDFPEIQIDEKTATRKNPAIFEFGEQKFMPNADAVNQSEVYNRMAKVLGELLSTETKMKMKAESETPEFDVIDGKINITLKMNDMEPEIVEKVMADIRQFAALGYSDYDQLPAWVLEHAPVEKPLRENFALESLYWSAIDEYESAMNDFIWKWKNGALQCVASLDLKEVVSKDKSVRSNPCVFTFEGVSGRHIQQNVVSMQGTNSFQTGLVALVTLIPHVLCQNGVEAGNVTGTAAYYDNSEQKVFTFAATNDDCIMKDSDSQADLAELVARKKARMTM